MRRATIDGLAADESVARSRRHRVDVMRVRVVEVVRAGIQRVDVADGGVPDVDVVDVNVARAEARIKRLVETRAETSPLRNLRQIQTRIPPRNPAHPGSRQTRDHKTDARKSDLGTSPTGHR